MTRDGGCFCGAVRYRVSGDPVSVAHCHCVHCRRTSAAAYVTWAEFPATGFAIVKGTPGRYSSRPGVMRMFCRDCGTQLTFESNPGSSTLDITACSLDDPASVTPQHHVWCDRMLPWVRPGDGLPHYPLRRK